MRAARTSPGLMSETSCQKALWWTGAVEAVAGAAASSGSSGSSCVVSAGSTEAARSSGGSSSAAAAAQQRPPSSSCRAVRDTAQVRPLNGTAVYRRDGRAEGPAALVTYAAIYKKLS